MSRAKNVPTRPVFTAAELAQRLVRLGDAALAVRRVCELFHVPVSWLTFLASDARKEPDRPEAEEELNTSMASGQIGLTARSPLAVHGMPLWLARASAAKEPEAGDERGQKLLKECFFPPPR